MAAACVLLVWCAGPAQASGPLDAVAAAAPAVTATVEQATAPVERTVASVAATVERSSAPAAAAVERSAAVAHRAVEPVREALAPVAPPPAPRPDLKVLAVEEQPAATAPPATAGSSATPAAPRPGADRRRPRSKQPSARAERRRAAAGERRIEAPERRAPARLLATDEHVARSDGTAVRATTERPKPTTAAGRSEPAQPEPAPTAGTATAGAASAGTTAAAVVFLLLLLGFAVPRLGELVRLVPAWAPPPPFLALPERPG